MSRSTEAEDALYADDPWAKLATAMGFRPYDTESTARQAFRACAPLFQLIEQIAKLEPDGDGDITFFANEFGYNAVFEEARRRAGLPPYLCIEVFPMDADGGLAELHADVDHWDILVRPDGGDPFKEYEGMTRVEAEDKCEWLKTHCPGIEPDWQLEDLLG